MLKWCLTWAGCEWVLGSAEVSIYDYTFRTAVRRYKFTVFSEEIITKKKNHHWIHHTLFVFNKQVSIYSSIKSGNVVGVNLFFFLSFFLYISCFLISFNEMYVYTVVKLYKNPWFKGLYGVLFRCDRGKWAFLSSIDIKHASRLVWRPLVLLHLLYIHICKWDINNTQMQTSDIPPAHW